MLTDKFRVLLSMLCVYSHNCKVLHWNANGKRFDMIHKLADEYYASISTDVDLIGEYMGMLDIPVVSYTDAFEVLKSAEGNYRIITSSNKFGYDDVQENISVMLSDVIKQIETLLGEEEISDNMSNVGIKAGLESMHERYSKEFRYFNARRKDN